MQLGGYSMEGPLWKLGSWPMDLTRTIVFAHVVTALLVAVAIGGGGSAWPGQLVFSAQSMRSLWIWTPVTYPFVHMVSIPLAIDLVILLWFGSEVETFLGRKAYGWLYLALAVIPAVVVFLLAPYLGDTSLVGAREIHFAIFVAFALIYPRARLIFNIEAKWFAIILLGISAITDLAYHQWMHLFYVWSTLGVLFYVMYRRGAGGCRAMVGWVAATTERTQIRASEARHERLRQSDEDARRKVDEILDKMSSQGIDSLTEKERKFLRKAGGGR